MMKPRRRFEVTIKVGGDSWDDVMHTVRTACEELRVSGPKIGVFGASATADLSILVSDLPDQTHDKYFQQVHAWLESQKPKEPKP